MSVPNGITDEYDVIFVKIFHLRGDGRKITLGDVGDFRLCPVKHRIVVFIVWNGWNDLYHIAVQRGLDGLRHPCCIACAGTIKDNVSSVCSVHIATFFTFISIFSTRSGLFLFVRQRFIFAARRCDH